MIGILLFFLISCFTCTIYVLRQYETITKIKDGYGLIALELDKFDINDKIYITYGAYNGDIPSYINYTFSDEFPTLETMELPNKLNSYTEGVTTHKHNDSLPNGGYRVYYTYDRFYYYEFEKKNNSKYLIMRYSFSPLEINYLKVENTKLSKNMKAIIAVSVTCGVLLLVGALILYIKCRNRCIKHSYSKDIDFNAKNNGNLSLPPESQILPPPADLNNNIPINQNYGQDNPYYDQDNIKPNIYPQVNNNLGIYGQPPPNDTAYNSS